MLSIFQCIVHRFWQAQLTLQYSYAIIFGVLLWGGC